MPAEKKPWNIRQIERMKEKEYSKTYLKERQKNTEKPNGYPVTRMILIRDFFRTPDLYKAIAFFLSAQIIIAIISSGVNNPNVAGAMNLLAIVLGVLVVLFAIREINKRQRGDLSRRPFKLSRVIVINLFMFGAFYAATTAYRLLDVPLVAQPNQASLDGLIAQLPLAMIITMVIVSPITEEIVFRELLPYATGPSILSFIIASAIFIALHAPSGLIGWTSYGILATGFLWARLIDNNVYTAIAVHMVWNAFTILI